MCNVHTADRVQGVGTMSGLGSVNSNHPAQEQCWCFSFVHSRWTALRTLRVLLATLFVALLGLLCWVWSLPEAPGPGPGPRRDDFRMGGMGMGMDRGMGRPRPRVASVAREYASPAALAVSASGDLLYVAQHTGKAVAVVDVKRREVTRRIDLPHLAQGLTLSTDGVTLYATCGEANGQVCRIDTKTGQITQTIPVGHTPLSPAATPDGQWLLVCDRFNNAVSIVGLSGEPTPVRVPVPREPVAVAVTSDSRTAVVANHLPAGRSDANFVTAVVSLLDIRTQEKLTDVPLANGSHTLRSVCLSPDDRYAYVTHVIGQFQLPTTQVDRGWMNTNAFSVIDLHMRQCLATVLLDDIDRGAANPWGIAGTADGRWLAVCHSGTHEISLIDRKALHAKIQNTARRDRITYDLAFLHSLRRRIPLTGQGARAIAVHGSKAYVGLYFEDAIDVITLDATTAAVDDTIRLGPEPTLTLERVGEMLFHDGRQCFQEWQTCASCHPDGATDGLNWDLLNDGMGNPKNAKSLLLSHVTPPVMITGVRPNAEFGVRAGMRGILFMALDEDSAQALDAYLKGVRPIPSPYLVNGQLSVSARRGQQVFAAAGCAGCHGGPYFTDMRMHAVGPGLGPDADQPWDTPTLVNVWRTAPYLYDGRAATMRDVLTTENRQNRHGITTTLTPQEIEDLAEYVLSL